MVVSRMILGSALTIAACAPGLAEEVALRAASFLPPHQSWGVPFRRWVGEVNKRGKGVLQISVVGPDAIPAFEQPNALKSGVIDMVSTPNNYYAGSMVESDTTSLAEIPPHEQRKNGAWALLNAAHNGKMNAWYLTAFGYGVEFHFYTTRAPKSDAARPLEGFSIRSTPIYKTLLENLGANAVTIAPGEVFTALERNVVQGYGWPLWGVRDMGWLPVTKYRVDPGFYTVAVNILVNLDRWKKLDERQRAFLTEMAIWLEAEWPKWREEEEKKEIDIQKQAGFQIVNLGADLRKKAHDAYWSTLEGRRADSRDSVLALKRLLVKQ